MFIVLFFFIRFVFKLFEICIKLFRFVYDFWVRV